MVGLYAEHSGTFLRVTALLTLVAFAIPITFAPFRWAAMLGWQVGERNDAALYFARCLGVVALVLVWAAWQAGGQPAVQPFYFNIFIGNTVLLALVHGVGAIQKVQPWMETAEIPFWGGLALLGMAFYPAAA